MKSNSKDLLHKAKNGDENALSRLIENHKDFAYTVALKYTKNKEDAQDAVQNAFIQVFKGIRSFRSEAQFSTWLYKIIYRESLRTLKKFDKEIYEPVFVERDYEQEDSRVAEEKVNELMKALNEREYLVTALFYLKEKSIKDIQKITSLSKANIKIILHRSREKLKAQRNEKRN